MSYSIEISDITATSCMVVIIEDGAGGGPQSFTIYESDGVTIVRSISDSDPSWHKSDIVIDGLTPNTTYILELDAFPDVTATFTTTADNPKIATESQWADLASRIKAMEARVTALEGN